MLLPSRSILKSWLGCPEKIKELTIKNVIYFFPVDSARDSAMPRPNLQSRLYLEIFQR